MNNLESDCFWEGGDRAWWRGLKDAMKAAGQRLKSADSVDEQREAQSQLDELKHQEADAKQNGGRRLF